MNFHSPIRVWRHGNNFIIKVELIDILLTVTPKQPKQYERLERLLDERELPPFITYDKNIEE
ncbi:hypothetical protein [Bacillus sp. FJAT-45037]|uniref:hypothetical protein n=1 Tax=Bacillus sp. FJAT-45037 TaxID=2011007 RepID=UPI000C23A3B6|nr:hypothetical protein [Bacillus sp. FJAT-45037]